MIDKTQLIALAGLVATGKSIRDAASQLGISEPTAYRWAKRAAYKKILSTFQDESMGALLGLLLASHMKAVAALESLLSEDSSETTRLKASEALITLSLKAFEAVSFKRELESRITDYENKFAELVKAKEKC